MASISYRLTGDEPVTGGEVATVLDAMDGPDTDPFRTAVLAAVEDTIHGLRWFTDDAERHSVDPDRIFVGGSSAGFIAALHAAYSADEFGIEVPDVRAVVDLWGGLILLPTDASAIDEDEPPLFVVYGEADEIVSFEFGAQLVERAEQIGLRHELVSVPGAGHAWRATDFFAESFDDGSSIIERIAAFMEAS